MFGGGEPNYLPAGMAIKPDAELLVGGQRYPIHSAVLGLNSPVLGELLSGEPSEAAAAGQLPAYAFAPPAPETKGEAEERPSWMKDYASEPPLAPECLLTFLRFCYGQAVEASREVPYGRMLRLASLLRSAPFTAALDAQLQRELLTGGGAEGLEGAAKVVVEHRLLKSAAALVAVLSPGEGGEERKDRHEDPLDAFEALDGPLKKLAFMYARLSHAERVAEGIASAPKAAWKLEQHLVKEGWAGEAGGELAGQRGRMISEDSY